MKRESLQQLFYKSLGSFLLIKLVKFDPNKMPEDLDLPFPA